MQPEKKPNSLPWPCRDFVRVIVITQELLKSHRHGCAISTGWSPNIKHQQMKYVDDDSEQSITLYYLIEMQNASNCVL